MLYRILGWSAFSGLVVIGVAYVLAIPLWRLQLKVRHGYRTYGARSLFMGASYRRSIVPPKRQRMVGSLSLLRLLNVRV